MSRVQVSSMKSFFRRLIPRRQPSSRDCLSTPAQSLSRTRVFERLETRNLLANLNLDIQLWTIDPNNPGQKGTLIPAIQTNPTKIFQVGQGTSFLVQVVTEDQPVATDPDQNSAGVIALPLDLAWNTGSPNVIRYADPVPPLAPAPIPLANQIVTDQFPRQRLVNSFDPDVGADDLRGATVPAQDNTTPIGIANCNPPNGKDDCREFSLLRFNAQQLGETPFSATLAGAVSFADGNRLDNIPAITVRIRVVETASVSGFVYIDTDNDGIRGTDPNNGAPIELGIPNAEVSLFRQGENTPVATTTTGANGAYHFENVVPGVYRIRETQPAAFLDGRDSLGFILPGAVARGTVGQDEFTNVEIRANEAAVDYNFGELGLRPERINKRLFLTSTQPARQIVAQQSGLTAATVMGTAGPDTINIDNDGQTIRVTVNNGPVQEFSTAQTKIVTVDAGGGADTVTLNGSAANELACVEPTYATLRRNDVPLSNTLGYAVEVINSESNTVDAGPGQTDRAILRDSPLSDELVAAGNLASLQWGTGTILGNARRFGTVRALSISGGIDTVDEQAHDYVLTLFGPWQ